MADYYVGLDVHKRQWTVHVLDAKGNKIEAFSLKGTWSQLYGQLARRMAERVAVGQTWDVCFEATSGIGWLYDQLGRIAQRVVPAHPRQLRKNKRKNDRIDAEKLAKLLLLEMVPAVWVPPEDIRGWRSLIEYRRGLLARRTAAKNALRALVHSCGLDQPRSLFSKKGRAWLTEQVWPTPLQRLQAQSNLEGVEQLHRQIREVTNELDRLGRDNACVQLLRTIPGVGPRTAEAFVAYVGDPKRFARAGQVSAYFGLVPCEDTSAGKQRLGHITKDGPSLVRWLLVEAAWQAVRRCPALRQRLERIQRGQPKRKRIAVVAIASHLARAMWAMMGSGESWREEAA
jgi:transposase